MSVYLGHRKVYKSAMYKIMVTMNNDIEQGRAGHRNLELYHYVCKHIIPSLTYIFIHTPRHTFKDTHKDKTPLIQT